MIICEIGFYAGISAYNPSLKNKIEAIEFSSELSKKMVCSEI